MTGDVLDETFRELVENLPDYAMIFLSPDGRVMTWNKGAELIKGYAADEIVGESVERFYTPEANAVGHPQRELEIAALSGRYDEEGWRVRKDGSRFWARVRIIAIYDEEGGVKAFGKVTSDLTERKQNEEQLQNVLRLLEQTIRIDHLTGLPNRRAWDERLTVELARATREGRPLTIAVLDIDHFKRVNDERGHAAGDVVLKQSALGWRRAVRPMDIVARYGGEEFTVALPGCGLPEARPVLERLVEASPAGQTCSIGVAEWDGQESGDHLLGRADRAMYEAKAGGRDRISIAA